MPPPASPVPGEPHRLRGALPGCRQRHLSFASLPSGRPKTVARLEGYRAHYQWGRGSKLPWRGTSGGLARRTEYDFPVQHDDVRRRWSGSPALVPMVQSSDFGHLHDMTHGWPLEGSGVRCVLAQRQVSPGLVVVRRVRRQNATERVLAKNDDVVQALMTEGSDKALRLGILPRGTGRRQDFLDVHAFDSSMEYLIVDPVTVADHVFGRRVLGKCFDDQLSSPGRAWKFGDIEVKDTLAVVRENKENVQNPEGCHVSFASLGIGG